MEVYGTYEIECSIVFYLIWDQMLILCYIIILYIYHLWRYGVVSLGTVFVFVDTILSSFSSIPKPLIWNAARLAHVGAILAQSGNILAPLGTILAFVGAIWASLGTISSSFWAAVKPDIGCQTHGCS
jgi:hypothetical protein